MITTNTHTTPSHSPDEIANILSQVTDFVAKHDRAGTRGFKSIVLGGPLDDACLEEVRQKARELGVIFDPGSVFGEEEVEGVPYKFTNILSPPKGLSGFGFEGWVREAQSIENEASSALLRCWTEEWRESDHLEFVDKQPNYVDGYHHLKDLGMNVAVWMWGPRFTPVSYAMQVQKDLAEHSTQVEGMIRLAGEFLGTKTIAKEVYPALFTKFKSLSKEQLEAIGDVVRALNKRDRADLIARYLPPIIDAKNGLVSADEIRDFGRTYNELCNAHEEIDSGLYRRICQSVSAVCESLRGALTPDHLRALVPILSRYGREGVGIVHLTIPPLISNGSPKLTSEQLRIAASSISDNAASIDKPHNIHHIDALLNRLMTGVVLAPEVRLQRIDSYTKSLSRLTEHFGGAATMVVKALAWDIPRDNYKDMPPEKFEGLMSSLGDLALLLPEGELREDFSFHTLPALIKMLGSNLHPARVRAYSDSIEQIRDEIPAQVQKTLYRTTLPALARYSTEILSPSVLNQYTVTIKACLAPIEADTTASTEYETAKATLELFSQVGMGITTRNFSTIYNAYGRTRERSSKIHASVLLRQLDVVLTNKDKNGNRLENSESNEVLRRIDGFCTFLEDELPLLKAITWPKNDQDYKTDWAARERVGQLYSEWNQQQMS